MSRIFNIQARWLDQFRRKHRRKLQKGDVLRISGGDPQNKVTELLDLRPKTKNILRSKKYGFKVNSSDSQISIGVGASPGGDIPFNIPKRLPSSGGGEEVDPGIALLDSLIAKAPYGLTASQGSGGEGGLYNDTLLTTPVIPIEYDAVPTEASMALGAKAIGHTIPAGANSNFILNSADDAVTTGAYWYTMNHRELAYANVISDGTIKGTYLRIRNGASYRLASGSYSTNLARPYHEFLVIRILSSPLNETTGKWKMDGNRHIDNGSAKSDPTTQDWLPKVMLENIVDAAGNWEMKIDGVSVGTGTGQTINYPIWWQGANGHAMEVDLFHAHIDYYEEDVNDGIISAQDQIDIRAELTELYGVGEYPDYPSLSDIWNNSSQQWNYTAFPNSGWDPFRNKTTTFRGGNGIEGDDHDFDFYYWDQNQSKVVPLPPVLDSPTILATNDGFVQQGDGDEVEIPAGYDMPRLQLRGITGTSKADPIMIVGEVGARPTVGNGTTSNHPLYDFKSSDSSTNYEVHNITIDGNNDTGSNIVPLADDINPNMVYSDIININTPFSAFFANSNTTVNGYGDITVRWMRSFQDIGVGDYGGECFYIGTTSNKTSENLPIQKLLIENNWGEGFAREPIQLTDCTNFLVNKSTFYLCAGSTLSGQNRLAQIHNSFGEVRNTIFHGGQQSLEIISHQVIFRNCYFRWDTDDQGLIGDMAGFGASARESGLAVKFIDCIFDPSVSQTSPTFNITQDLCDIEFIDCKEGSNCHADLYVDNRVDQGTFDITETNTTAWTDGVPTYSYTGEANVDQATFGNQTNRDFQDRGMGYACQGNNFPAHNKLDEHLPFHQARVELISGQDGSVNGITDDLVGIMSGAEAFDTDVVQTAINVAANINANTATLHKARAYQGLIIIMNGTGTIVSDITTIEKAADISFTGDGKTNGFFNRTYYHIGNGRGNPELFQKPGVAGNMWIMWVSWAYDSSGKKGEGQVSFWGQDNITPL